VVGQVNVVSSPPHPQFMYPEPPPPVPDRLCVWALLEIIA